MKVYVVSHGWMSDGGVIRPMTQRVFEQEYDAKQFCAKWKTEQGGMKYNTPFAFYDEIEVE